MALLALVVALGMLGVACASPPPGLDAPGPTIEEAIDDPDARFFWEQPGIQHESLVPLGEIRSGGPPPDGIPPIDEPRFVATDDARDWLADQEPVVVLEEGDDVRAYPLQILLWHEIVNDVVGGRPVAVTYCPLCNSAIVFDRTVNGNVLSFGTSGRVYKSDLVMYDRQTKSLWVQFLGRAVVGPLIRSELERIASPLVMFEDLRARWPDALVLSRDTGFDRPYGRTPYAGYDSSNDPFLFDGPTPGPLPAIARVVGVQAGGGAKAFAVDALRAIGDPAVLNDDVGMEPIVVFFVGGARSTLDDARTDRGRDVGSSAAFSRLLDGDTLRFEAAGDSILDAGTGSRWNIFGEAVEGPLRGARLRPVDRVDTFWFAWSVFVPDAPLWR